MSSKVTEVTEAAEAGLRPHQAAQAQEFLFLL